MTETDVKAMHALADACDDLVRWHETAILSENGPVRTRARMLFHVPSYLRLRVAENDVNMEACKAIPALCDAYEAQAKEIERLNELLREARRAIGDHNAPNDCYATGPLTGDPFRDLVQCPACSFIAMYDEHVSTKLAKEIGND